MLTKRRNTFFSLFLILAVCLNLLNFNVVYADDATPTEPPPATEIVTEPPTATEVATEPPVETTPESVESTPLPVDSTTEPVEATPVPVEATATPITEILTQVPEGTEVVVLDESGSTIALATQEAAEIVEINDPMWCPAGVLPGGAGCSASFATISELVDDMRNTTASYTQNGVIYFTATAVESFVLTTQGTSLGGTDFNALNDFNLTLQGGWNGAVGALAALSGQTDFGTYSFTIGTASNPWIGNITLNDFAFDSGSQTAIRIFTTTGNITLSNVDVTNQGNASNTAQLNSTLGNITVQNGSTFDGDGTANAGFSATASGSGASITVSDTTFSDAAANGNGSNNDGATLNADVVTLTNVTSTGNDGDGIRIIRADLVTLNNVTASNNGTENGVDGLASNDGSGVSITGLALPGNPFPRVIINGGTFNNNQEYGVEITNNVTTGLYIQSIPTCTGNDSNAAATPSCYNDTFIVDGTAPIITPTVTGTAGSNGWHTSDVSVSWSVTDAESNVFSSNGCTTANLTSETSGTTLTCSASNNAGLSNSVSVNIKIDKTGPSASLAIIAGTLGSNGWYTSDVTVQTSGADSMSNPVTCTSDQIQSTETMGTVINGSCTNDAGLTTNASPVTIKLDKTAPTLTLPSNITAEATGATGAVVNYTATVTDNLDALVSLNCSPASGSTFALGGTPVNCSSTDIAGNTALGTFQVTVDDSIAPIIAPHGDETAEATSAAGVSVIYTNPATTDAVDGTGTASCSPTSGSTFALGNTTVDCTASDVDGNSATPTSFVVHVVDTTPPTIAPHANLTINTLSSVGIVVNFSSPATSDSVDGAGTATCLPASGSLFPIGNTQVTCSAVDSNGNNAADTTFVVHLIKIVVTPPTPPAPTPASVPAQIGNGFVIPITGGGAIDLACNSIFWVADIKIGFLNLCDYQSAMQGVDAKSLPGKLPQGYSFVMGVDVDVLLNGQAIKELPVGSGIQFDFPVNDAPKDQFVVLYWSDDDGDGKGVWLEVSQEVAEAKLSEALLKNAADELYRITRDSLNQADDIYYPIVTTEKTGIFALVTK